MRSARDPWKRTKKDGVKIDDQKWRYQQLGDAKVSSSTTWSYQDGVIKNINRIIFNIQDRDMSFHVSFTVGMKTSLKQMCQVCGARNPQRPQPVPQTCTTQQSLRGCHQQ